MAEYGFHCANICWHWVVERALNLIAASAATRSDMMQSTNVGVSLDTRSVELDADQYRNGQLRNNRGNRLDQLPAALQSKAYEFRNEVLGKLGKPLEIELYFVHMQARNEAGEEGRLFFLRLLELAQCDAAEGVVVIALSSIDTCGTSAIFLALLAVRSRFDQPDFRLFNAPYVDLIER